VSAAPTCSIGNRFTFVDKLDDLFHEDRLVIDLVDRSHQQNRLTMSFAATMYFALADRI